MPIYEDEELRLESFTMRITEADKKKLFELSKQEKGCRSAADYLVKKIRRAKLKGVK